MRNYESATSRVEELQRNVADAQAAEREARDNAATSAEERRQLQWNTQELTEQLEHATSQLADAAASRRSLQR